MSRILFHVWQGDGESYTQHVRSIRATDGERAVQRAVRHPQSNATLPGKFVAFPDPADMDKPKAKNVFISYG